MTPWPIRLRDERAQQRWAKYRRALPDIEAARFIPIPRHRVLEPTPVYRTPEAVKAYEAALALDADTPPEVMAARVHDLESIPIEGEK